MGCQGSSAIEVPSTANEQQVPMPPFPSDKQARRRVLLWIGGVGVVLLLVAAVSAVVVASRHFVSPQEAVAIDW